MWQFAHTQLIGFSQYNQAYTIYNTFTPYSSYDIDCLKMGSLPLVISMAYFLESMLKSQV